MGADIRPGGTCHDSHLVDHPKKRSRLSDCEGVLESPAGSPLQRPHDEWLLGMRVQGEA
jgi:hypothetical protein